MSTKVVHITTCDYCGDDAKADQTIRFNVGAVDYEADVCEAHLQALAATMAPWVNGARRTRKPRRAPGSQK